MLSCLQTIVNARDAALAIQLGLDLQGLLRVVVVILTPVGLQARSAPWQGRHVGRLRHDGRRDLVSQGPHGFLGRPDESNLVFGEQFRQSRVLRGMAPAGPDSLGSDPLSNVQNQVHIGVVVVV